MKKDNAALFILFSMLTYVPLAEAQLPDCEKITTSAVAGQGRYAVFCGQEQIKDEYGKDSFSEEQADAIMKSKREEAQKYQDLKDQDAPDPKDGAPFSD